MKKENISDALNNIDFDMVEDVYESTKQKKKSNKSLWLKWGAIAACLSLIVMGGIFGNLFHSPDTPDVPENNIMSFFAIVLLVRASQNTICLDIIYPYFLLMLSHQISKVMKLYTNDLIYPSPTTELPLRIRMNTLW